MRRHLRGRRRSKAAGRGPGRTVPPRALRAKSSGAMVEACPRDSRAGGEVEGDQHRTMGGSGQEGGGKRERGGVRPDSPPRRREVSFPGGGGGGRRIVRARWSARVPRGRADAAAAVRPVRTGPRERRQVSAAKSSRRKSILRTLGKSLGEENERRRDRNALDIANDRRSTSPSLRSCSSETATPEKDGRGEPGLWRVTPSVHAAKSKNGLISQLDTDTPVTSTPVRSSRPAARTVQTPLNDFGTQRAKSASMIPSFAFSRRTPLSISKRRRFESHARRSEPAAFRARPCAVTDALGRSRATASGSPLSCTPFLSVLGRTNARVSRFSYRLHPPPPPSSAGKLIRYPFATHSLRREARSNPTTSISNPARASKTSRLHRQSVMSAPFDSPTMFATFWQHVEVEPDRHGTREGILLRDHSLRSSTSHKRRRWSFLLGWDGDGGVGVVGAILRRRWWSLSSVASWVLSRLRSSCSMNLREQHGRRLGWP